MLNNYVYFFIICFLQERLKGAGLSVMFDEAF